MAAARGYPMTLTMPETMSLERRKVLKLLGAKIILTDGALGMKGAIAKAEEIVASDPNRYVLLQQFQNPANPRHPFQDHRSGNLGRHRRRRSTRWWPASAPAAPSPAFRATSSSKEEGDFVGGRGAARQRRHQPDAGGKPLEPGPHKIQGIGAGFIPDTLDLKMVDRVEQVSDEEAIEMARRLAKEEGILCGISCGAAVAAAVKLAHEPAMKGKMIVVILPDSGERYLSSALVDDLD